MLGHGLSFIVCCLVGHGHLLWDRGPRGLRWRCDRCHRTLDSQAVRKVAA